MTSPTPHPKGQWVSISHRKRAHRQSLLPKAWLLPKLPSSQTLDVRSVPSACGLLSPLELSITSNHDAISLLSAISSRTYTSLQITTAFCKRAAIAQQLTNCLTEIFFDEALKRASWLDAEYKRTGNLVGPLHGLPISIKDTFHVKGYDSCIGIASLAFSPAKENALLVDILLEAGAVLYCKTNIPQGLTALDSDNHVFGRVLNPRDRNVTAGGSSGGEGALIALRGSIIGVGTDIGGSIRIPAMCNGLYGFKPSSQRIPYVGQESGVPEGLSRIALQASAGPIATTLRDCELLLKVIADCKPWKRDPAMAYGPWEQQGQMQKKPLIGIIRTDGLITPLPPISNIINETASALQSAGIETISIPAPAFKKCQSLANAFFSIEGSNHLLDLLEKTQEPLTNWLSTRVRRKDHISLQKLIEIQVKRQELEMEMLKVFTDPKTGREVDAFICPVAPHPAPGIDKWNGVSYTSTFVMLDWPAGTVPIRDVKDSDLAGEMEGKSLNGWDKINRELWDGKNLDRNIYKNTTLSVQVVAPKLQERRLYQAMDLIDQIMKKASSAEKKKNSVSKL